MVETSRSYLRVLRAEATTALCPRSLAAKQSHDGSCCVLVDESFVEESLVDGIKIVRGIIHKYTGRYMMVSLRRCVKMVFGVPGGFLTERGLKKNVLANGCACLDLVAWLWSRRWYVNL